MENIAPPDTESKIRKLELCPGLLILELLNDGRIAVFTFPPRTRNAIMNTREVADVWSQTLKEQVQNLTTGQSWFRIHDFSEMNIPPTPYFIAKLIEASKHRPELHGHSAFVLPRNLFTQAMRNLSYRIQSPHIKIRLFFSRQEALNWLMSHIEAAPDRIGILAPITELSS